APAQSPAASLLDKSALQAALSAGRPDIRSFAIDSMTQLDSSTSLVAFSYTGAKGSNQGKFEVRHSGETQFLLYQGWRLIISPTLLQLTLPKGMTSVAIDGRSLALPDGKSIEIGRASCREGV